MSTDFKTSLTCQNLMRAFAGESQARNRYTIAAAASKNQALHVVEAVFTFTANQEKEHAEIFYNHLSSLADSTIKIDGTYPVDAGKSVVQLLRSAEHNELEEYNDVYKNFSDTAKQEGFEKIANDFQKIAEIEKTHAERFARFAELLETNTLFISDIECKWMCLNCGHIYEGKTVPEICPVCSHNKGYFIRLTMAPYSAADSCTI